MTLGFTPVMAQTHRGKASYYSKRATGARSASGERIHHDSLTCAHRSYPFGTLLKVTNLSNGKEVIVRVTDRGPYGRNRIIDLSYGAAKELGMLSQGIAMVEVQRIDGTTPPYRMDETERGLPAFEFDFTKAAYSFIDDWSDEDNESDQDLSEEEKMVEQKMPSRKQAQAKRRSIQARAKSQSTQKERTGSTNLGAAAQANMRAQKHAPAKTKNQSKEKDPSFWSSVFDKVKNWFGD